MSRKKPYRSTEICLFYTVRIKSRFSVKRLHEYIECRDVRTELFIRIFEVSIFSQIVFKKPGAYAPMFQNSTPTN